MKPLTAASPHAIIMVGIPGAGKSTFAEQFADTFKSPIVSSTGLARKYQLQPDEAVKLQDEILDQFLKTGRTLLVDGNSDTREQRDAIVKKLRTAGYRPLLVWVQTDTAEALYRAQKDFPKGSGITEAQFNQIISTFEAPQAKEKTVVISGKHTYQSQLKIVLKQLAIAEGRQAASSAPTSASTRSQSGSVQVRVHPHTRTQPGR